MCYKAERRCKDMKAKVYPEATWDAIRTEYITTDASYKALAKLYGVPFSQIRARSVEEDWIKKRKEFVEKRRKEAIEKAHEFYNDENDRTIRIASKLLDKIEVSVDALLPEDRDGIKKLTSAISDLKNIGIFRADLDREEQLARIAKLKKDASEEVHDNTIVIKFENSDIEEYAN